MLSDSGWIADILCGVVDLWIQRRKLVHWRQERVVNCVGKRTVRSGLGTESMIPKSDVTFVRVADCIPASFFTSFHHLLGWPSLKCSTLAA